MAWIYLAESPESQRPWTGPAKNLARESSDAQPLVKLNDKLFEDKRITPDDAQFLRDAQQERSCVCGHLKSAHIYEEGACRPGFKCQNECRQFLEVRSAKDTAT